MASLVNLPGELHHLIFSHFSTDTRTPDGGESAEFGQNRAGIHTLTLLSRTCRGLNHAVKPYLYAEVNLGSQSSRKLVALLRHFVNDPYSGSCVRWVRIDWDDLLCQKFDCSDQEANFLADVARSLHLDVPPAPPWYSADWRNGFLAGMVLLKSSGVELVDIEGHNQSFCSSIPEQSPRPELRQFRQFNHAWHTRTTKSTRDLHRLINLSPHLQGFRSAKYPVANPDEINWTEVTSLVLEENENCGGARVTTDGIVFVVRSCQKLHDVRIKPKDRGGPAPIIDALQTYHKDTLKRLTLVSFPSEETNLDISFSAFNALEVLEIHGNICRPGFALKDLPHSLRELRLDGDFHGVREDFEIFTSEFIKGSYPHFETAGFQPMYSCSHENCPFMLDGHVIVEDMIQYRDWHFDQAEAEEYEGGKCRTQWEIIYGLVNAGVNVWVD
ncbi:hypothetical protein GCG54_00015715 [Colletotrichum gloeosporioides]|uniref:Uncharacterized protein n=1 Tax=Colletotrichum gloeosporioides TaxID=474922 RepID=A0A8H4FDI2_COLGL|nr:uncharacterized protein GCG54_00015715 [Colletotrichum gloeosporioides]KAF3798392.1 hypothetical protein GCG54_00015715 [Colletotrichum gloeosporioides]